MHKNRSNIIYICMIIFTFLFLVATGTYAYYQSTITSTVSGNISKWSFTVNDQTGVIDLDLNGVYPGKTGTYTIELSAENSDLDVYYELKFNNPNTINPNAFDIMDYLYWNSSLGNSARYFVGRYGIIPAGEKITLSLYFNWPYDGNDNEGIADGIINDFVNISIIGRQYTAYSGSIPLKLSGSYTYNVIDDTSGYIYQSHDYSAPT